MMKNMKTKFNSGDDLSVKKTLKLYHMAVVVISFFSWGQQMLSTSLLRLLFV